MLEKLFLYQCRLQLLSLSLSLSLLASSWALVYWSGSMSDIHSKTLTVHTLWQNPHFIGPSQEPSTQTQAGLEGVGPFRRGHLSAPLALHVFASGSLQNFVVHTERDSDFFICRSNSRQVVFRLTVNDGANGR